MNCAGNELRKLFRAASGLFIYAVGAALMIQAGLGLSPWESLSMGTSQLAGVSFGLAHTVIGILILAADILMKEKIGLSTLLDAFVVGFYVDFVLWTDLIPHADSMISGILMIAAALFIIPYGQYFYISAGLGCGPRDTFFIAIGKRLAFMPIGAVQSLVYIVIIVISFVIGGPVGAGTAITVLCSGFAMEIVFRTVHFEPRSVKHENIFESVASVFRYHGYTER